MSRKPTPEEIQAMIDEKIARMNEIEAFILKMNPEQRRTYLIDNVKDLIAMVKQRRGNDKKAQTALNVFTNWWLNQPADTWCFIPIFLAMFEEPYRKPIYNLFNVILGGREIE